MNVLMVCGIYTDGHINTSSQFVHHQALALKKQGINVTVLSLDTRSIRRKRKFGITKYIIDDIPVYVGSFPCGPLGAVLKYVSKTLATKAFKHIIKEQGLFDIIHGHFYYNSYAIIDMAKKYNIPLVTTEHSSAVLSINNNEKIKNDATYVYEHSDKVICVSEGLYSSIKSFYSGEITVVNNIVPGNFKYENIEKYKPFTFVSTGNLVKLKRYDLTLKAFAKFTSDTQNARLIIIGGGDLKKELKALAKQLKIDDKVDFKGIISNSLLSPIYNKSHSFILPSDYETFGVAYIEAIAAGLPAISGKHAKQNKIINTENGIAISESTFENVYSAMKYIYDNYEMYNKTKMSQDIIEKYSEEKIVHEIIDIYTSAGLLEAKMAI